jgi:sulfur relay protein TusB/DsrH
MLVVIKSAPHTDEAKRGIKLAKDLAADVLLLQNAVYMAEKERLEGFCGSAYALEADLRLRGVSDVEKEIRTVGYDEAVDLMAGEDKVVGFF